MQFMKFYGPTFTLDIPTDWTIGSTNQLQAIFISPSLDNGQRVNLAIALKTIEAGQTAQTLGKLAGEMQQENYNDFEVIAESDFTFNERPALEHKFRWVNPNTGDPVIQHQTYLMDDQFIYILTASRPSDLDEKNSQRVDALFEQVLGSFSIVG